METFVHSYNSYDSYDSYYRHVIVSLKPAEIPAYIHTKHSTYVYSSDVLIQSVYITPTNHYFVQN